MNERLQEIRERHEIESAMDTNSEYSEWSQPALAARLRQSNRDRADLLGLVDELQEQVKSIAEDYKEIKRLRKGEALHHLRDTQRIRELEAERDEILNLWLQDADPLETRFAEELEIELHAIIERERDDE